MFLLAFDDDGGTGFFSRIANYGMSATESTKSVQVISSTDPIKNNGDEKFEQDLLVYPNPTNDLFTIQLRGEIAEDLMLKITDASGRVILQREIPNNGNLIQEEVDLGTSPAGFYFIHLYNETYQSVKKLVVY